MLILSVLLVGAGLGLVTYGLAQQRRVATSASPAAIALMPSSEVEQRAEQRSQLGVVYRSLAPVLDAGASAVRRVSPAARLDLVRDRITWAGLDGTLSVQQVLSAKAGAAVLGVLLGLTGAPGSVPTLLWVLGLAFAASFVPDVLLSSRATSRQEQVARSLPEALDLLALCVEAGLGFEQALEVVVDHTDGPLATELTRMLREVELGVPRREALGGLRERTSVPELSSFVVALMQSDQMGIALSDVLKSQAAHVRLLRRQNARERAAKTPVKILVPVVLGIFPALFVVTVGPGVIAIAESIFTI